MTKINRKSKVRRVVTLAVCVFCIAAFLALCASPVLTRPHGTIYKSGPATGLDTFVLQVSTYNTRNHQYVFSINYRGPKQGVSFKHNGIVYDLSKLDAKTVAQDLATEVLEGEARFKIACLDAFIANDVVRLHYGLNPHDYKVSYKSGDSIVIGGTEIVFDVDIKDQNIVNPLHLTVDPQDSTWATGMN
jgi:hypothetical protein